MASNSQSKVDVILSKDVVEKHKILEEDKKVDQVLDQDSPERQYTE